MAYPGNPNSGTYGAPRARRIGETGDKEYDAPAQYNPPQQYQWVSAAPPVPGMAPPPQFHYGHGYNPYVPPPPVGYGVGYEGGAVVGYGMDQGQQYGVAPQVYGAVGGDVGGAQWHGAQVVPGVGQDYGGTVRGGRGRGGDRGRGRGGERGRGRGGGRGRGMVGRGAQGGTDRGGATDRGRGRGIDRGRGRGSFGDRGRGGGRGRGGSAERGMRGGSMDRGIRGGSAERGRGGSRGRGRAGSAERGRGGFARGTSRGGGMERGRGRGDPRGRVAGARGRGVPGRGRGADRGRGIDRGRGGRGVARGAARGTRGALAHGRGGVGGRGRGARGAGRGRSAMGAQRRAGSEDRPVRALDTGVDISSLGDLVQSAKRRKMMGETAAVVSASPEDSLQVLVEKWKSFALQFVDCGNAISNIECSIKASKINYLQLSFDCKFLFKCQNYDIFTGVFYINKRTDDNGSERTFIARGLGLNKKSAKLDCYDKAYNLLLKSTAAEMLAQEDCGEDFLVQEVRLLFKENRAGFLKLLKKCNAVAELEDAATRRPETAGSKRSATGEGGGSQPKKARPGDYDLSMMDHKHLSLAPQKKVGILMNPEDPLIKKMAKLKVLLKDEGITDLHLVPKIDQIAHKTALHIRNVYRYDDIPIMGYENCMLIYCEIYLDDVFMARGNAEYRRSVAMQDAYEKLNERLFSTPLTTIVESPNVWHHHRANEPDICNIVIKWQGEDNNSLLTTNLANMKQMMQAMPDLDQSLNDLVLTEHESDKDIENAFKALELSATRNLMLLECEIVRNVDLTFTCSLSLQGMLMASRTHHTKNGAKRMCSEAIMKRLKKSRNTVYILHQGYVGKTITKAELAEIAKQKHDKGDPPGKIFRKAEFKSEDKMSSDAKVKTEEDTNTSDPNEDLTENLELKPLLPWVAAAVYDFIDEYYQKITLEDLLVDFREMTKSQRDVITACAIKMGLRVVTKMRVQQEGSVLRRTTTAQEMNKILQLHNGESGRYRLVSLKHKESPKELEQFQQQWLERHRKFVEARENDDPETVPLSSGSSLDKTSSNESLHELEYERQRVAWLEPPLCTEPPVPLMAQPDRAPSPGFPVPPFLPCPPFYRPPKIRF